MHLRFDRSLIILPRAAIGLLCVVVLSVGCNQHRYKPADRRAAARESTVPVREASTAGNLRWNSLPMNRMGTWPLRNADGSTLPRRGMQGGTLPMRNWSTLPGGAGMSTLPGGARWGPPRQNWSTLPNRGGVGGTLPQRQTYPEYRIPRRNWSTLPSTGGRQLVPSTLPMRGEPRR